MREQRREYWAKMIAEQEATGTSIRGFCRQRGIGDHSFYYWRRRLKTKQSVRFALVKAIQTSAPAIELFLPGGERLCIPAGADTAILRSVLDALRS